MFDDIPISWAPKTLYGCNELSPSDTMFELFGNIWKHLETSYSHSWRHHVTWGLCGWAAWRWFCWPLASSRPEWLQPWWTYCKSLERFESLVGSSRFKIFLRSIMMIKIKHDQTWSNMIKHDQTTSNSLTSLGGLTGISAGCLPSQSRHARWRVRRAERRSPLGVSPFPRPWPTLLGSPGSPVNFQVEATIGDDHWWPPCI